MTLPPRRGLNSRSQEKGVQMGADVPLLDGKCECAVRYRVADGFVYASNCHCSRCRAATGSGARDLVVNGSLKGLGACHAVRRRLGAL
jgi:hypothetical protein